MKHIKFRVWNTISKRYTYFSEPQFDFMPVDGRCEPIVMFKNTTLSLVNNVMLDGYSEAEQFIGLQDRHGVDIYEQDIVTFNAEFPGEYGGPQRGVVEYDESCAMFVVRAEAGRVYEFGFEIKPELTVVGCAHDN